MAMSVGGDSTEEKPMSDINTTPLVDVMLVLLIIFLIAVPVVVQTVEVDLPEVLFEPTQPKAENVSLSVRGNESGCQVFWGMSPVSSGELLERGVAKLKADIERQGGIGNPNLELPEVHIRGDVDTPYSCIGGTIYTMQSAGYATVGFISEPAPGSTVMRRM